MENWSSPITFQLLDPHDQLETKQKEEKKAKQQQQSRNDITKWKTGQQVQPIEVHEHWYQELNF